ncbi:MAG: PIN domain-containing protein [Hyphomicrobiaceae bacterium]
MMLIDTTVLVDVLRDASGANGRRLLAVLQSEDVAFTRFTELEILAGARDDADWGSIQAYLASETLLEPIAGSWSGAARIYFDLRRAVRTVRKVIDCCIAQIALERNVTLLHNDRDFETIATVRPLKHVRLQLASSP